ncbi:flagellin [Clostridium gasigenes]|uniref:flagellin N-terminal helical domain-containing protein n=1 Tax=Clostridium gasigenes TaxID=94869 RepID=UPI001C0B341C|nr:flagellin [Clostridium gasigenes]MBU3135991.1 flagellin [Clostridium gasigenes]
MIINHNMGAMNANRQMGINAGNAGKSMEKLSSGLRINRAGDDAAGLAISEKMRGQIRGLDQASANSQDAISLIGTAEGGLNETHSILQRMRELAVQSSTDTNVNVDRKAIQDEMDQLTSEVGRIADTTEFNTQKLLDGSFNGKFQIGANNGQDLSLAVGKMDAAGLGLVSQNSIEDITLAVGSDLKDGVYKVSGTNILDVSGNTVGTTDAAKITINGIDTPLAKAVLGEGATITVKAGSAHIDNTISANAKANLAPGTYEIKGTNVVKDGRLVGTFDAAGKKITVGGKDVSEADLGFKVSELKDTVKFTVKGADVSSRDAAQGTIDSISKAIENVSSERSKLGAFTNRLEHTIANLGTASENLTSAESRIRDVNMAKEMSTFSKNNILSQAAQAMLSQANQQPQQVLQLLR